MSQAYVPKILGILQKPCPAPLLPVVNWPQPGANLRQQIFGLQPKFAVDPRATHEYIHFTL